MSTHAVAVRMQMRRGHVPRCDKRRGQQEAGLVLRNSVRRHVTLAGLEAGVGELGEAERVAVVEGRLLRVADQNSTW